MKPSLLAAPSEPSPADKALLAAAWPGDVAAAARALRDGADPGAVDRHGWSALMHMAWEGSVAGASLLIEAGCPLELRDADGWTAATLAANQGHDPCLRLLIAAGANARDPRPNKRPALCAAATESHLDCLRTLLMSISPRDNHPETLRRCARWAREGLHGQAGAAFLEDLARSQEEAAALASAAHDPREPGAATRL